MMRFVAFAALLAAAQLSSAQSGPLLSDQRYKNVQVLKGIPLDDFMGTMGVMTGSLSFDCSDCHTGAGTDQVDWAADTQRKVVARKMVVMVNNINKENFGGRSVITCYSCHHGRDKPLSTPSLDDVYGSPNLVADDVIQQAEGQPPAEQIIDRYIRAIGGAEKLAAVKSFTATGNSIGFGGFGGGADVSLYAKFPNQRTLIIDYVKTAGRGDTTRSFDGKVGWLRTPLNILGEYQLGGGELDGELIDAELSFPIQLKQVLTQLRVGLPSNISELGAPESQESAKDNIGIGKDKLVDVVQGNGPRGMLVTLYFDHETGLLLRLLRMPKTQIGRVPTIEDYSDYRDVQGIKMPFQITFAWLNGRDAIKLKEVKLNAPIDPKVFGRPAPQKNPVSPGGGE